MIKHIGIIGAGTMGRGIAQVAALSGFEVILHDVSVDMVKSALDRIKEDLQRGLAKGAGPADTAEVLARIHPAKNFDEMRNADFIVEAAIEDLGAKQEIFRKLNAIVRPDVILATNTSSLSVTSIAAQTRYPGSVVGMHFFNPPPLMKLVEIVRGHQTSETTVESTTKVTLTMGKKPVVCRDTPGFIVNRIARPFYGEALRLLGEGIATVEEIDRIVKLEGGFRMGPFELMDLIGIDVNYAVTKSVYEQFFQEPRFRPHPIQRHMVEAGTLGRKTKKGFYTYK